MFVTLYGTGLNYGQMAKEAENDYHRRYIFTDLILYSPIRSLSNTLSFSTKIHEYCR